MSREASVLERPDLRPTDVTRAEVEDLLYLEAALLDEWRMEEWLELWTEDAAYVVPTNDNPHADPENDLMYVNHDHRLLKGLVVRLLSVRAHREYPWSKTRHMVTNVRVLGEDRDGVVHADAAFVVWRYRLKDADSYVGRYDLQFRRVGSELRLKGKRVTLDAWTLAPYGAVSIVLQLMRNARRLVDGARRGGVPVAAGIALRSRHTGRHAADDRPKR